jgi:eukaryotic translation initiation factor 2C
MVRERISDWYDENGKKYPKNILYYRDGVSESQYMTVKLDELPHLRTAFNQFWEETESQTNNNKSPLGDPPTVNITAVVVTKRHHTRFYPRAEADKQYRNGNCKPGTLVERGVTSPYFTDFYLQSHNGIKGTARPAHYWALQNEMGIWVSELQHLVRHYTTLPTHSG